MSLFDLVINIIESSIMCYFIYKYFDFKNIEKLWLFILIDFTSITLCNYFINESSILLIVVISVLVACLKIFGEKIRIESIVICFLSLIIDIVCNVISLIIGRIINYSIGMQFVQMPAMIVFSKILYFIVVLAFLKKKTSYKSQLNPQRWLTIIIVISILFIVAYILGTSYVFDNVSVLANLFCTALIFIAIILNKLFKYATDMNLYDVNPMQYYKVQNDSNRYLVEWDFDTLNTIFELCKGTRLHMFLHCFFGTDLKMNEILALKWDDLYIGHKNIKKNNCYAVVNKKLKRKKISYINEHRENIIKQFDPKINDEGSTRLVIYKIENSKKIHIPINVAKMLIKWKKVEGRKYQISYEEYENNDLVFSLLNGKACEDRIINKEFDKLKYENNLPDVKMSRLEFFSKERIIYKEEVMTIRDFYYRTLFYDYSEYFEIGYIKSGLSYNNNIIPIGTNYRSVNLKDINVPKKKEIDLSKMISLIKNNSSLSNELTSILKE